MRLDSSRDCQVAVLIGDQLLGKCPAGPMRALNRPASLRPGPSPFTQVLIANVGSWEVLLVQQPAVLIQRGGGLGALEVALSSGESWRFASARTLPSGMP